MNTEKILRITWIDSAIAASNADFTLEDAKAEGLHTCVSVGHLVFENEELVCIALTLDADWTWRGLLWVPKVCITERTELSVQESS